MNSRAPLFISGVYRSGTTLPVKILNGHPEVSLTHDSVNFFRYYLHLAPTIESDYKAVISDCSERLAGRFGIEVPTLEVVQAIESKEQITLASVFQELMQITFCAGHKDVIWGEKSLMQWSNIPLFLQMYEGAKAIMILRDPRNVLASFRDFTIEPGARYLDAVFACLHAMKWASTVGSALCPSKFRVVYYEDVVKDPEAWSREICDFLEVKYSKEMIDSENFKDHKGDKWSPNTSYQDLGGTISTNPVDRWKEKLSEIEICFAESILGEAMNTHGYQTSDVKVSANQLTQLLKTIGETDLLQHRLAHWFETGNGFEGHPSDPTKPANWSKSMLPKDKIN